MFPSLYFIKNYVCYQDMYVPLRVFKNIGCPCLDLRTLDYSLNYIYKSTKAFLQHLVYMIGQSYISHALAVYCKMFIFGHSNTTKNCFPIFAL